MLNVLSCIAYEHDYRFVLLAVVISACGSLLSMRLLARMRRSFDARRYYWLFMAGLLGGATIWTTHFVAMLGYDLPFEHAYEPVLTLLSLIIAVTVVTLAFWVTASTARGAMIEVGGVILGLGIVTMHYTGMAAYQVAGTVSWDWSLVAASVLLGMGFGALAMNRLARPYTRFCKFGSAAALALGIVAMHMTAMTAITLTPDPSVAVPPQAISDHIMVSAVVAVMALFLATGFSSYMIDLHSFREAADKYRTLAMQDPLTGLPNRAHLASKLDGILHSRPDDNSRIAVVAFDLDRFKDTNDVHGHAAGDMVLTELAARLTAALSEGEFVARIGGDEFVAVKTDLYSTGEASRFGTLLLDLARKPIVWKDRELEVGASVGVCIFPDDGETPDDLLSRADMAMYCAKSQGRNQLCLFDRSMDEVSRRRSALAIDMRHALNRDEFELYYQPQHTVADGETIGFEVLLRWHHGERGMVSPTEFIPIAEETGLIAEIGAWVLRTACAEAASWQKPYRIAVNVSPSQLAQENLPRLVHEILLETGLAPQRLEIEITETGIIADQQHAMHAIRQLKALGVTVAMDDYGTGYSSLSTLQNVPFDKIKIDRQFIDGVISDRQAAAIVKATIILGRSLEIPVLAEGVETAEHIEFLRNEGCDEVQGFYYGKPVPASEIVHIVGRRSEQPQETATPKRRRARPSAQAGRAAVA